MPVRSPIPWKVSKKDDLYNRYEQNFGGKKKAFERAQKKLNSLVRKILFFTFLFTTFLFIFLLFFKPPLPDKKEIFDKVIHQEPFQNKEVIGTQTLEKGDYRYKISPKFSYELYGLVVSEYNSENVLDVMHKKDPAQIKDLCVVWGDNITTGVYRDIKYKSGEFTCFAQAKNGVDWGIFSGEHLSNNHLVPATDEIAQIIRKANVGDQVFLRGYLSSYEIYDESGELVSMRGTSVRRDDGGNGACETIYVTEFKILEGKNYIFKLVRRFAGTVSIVSFVGLFVAILFI